MPKATGKRAEAVPSPSANPPSDLHWIDLSVIPEMAKRLRAAGLWDNNLAEGCIALERRIAALERFSKYEGWNYGEIRRPLKSWQDCRRLLEVIAGSRWVTFSDVPAVVGDCLTLAVLLDRWERAEVPVPDDMRGMMHGAIAVEWRDPVGGIIISLGTCHTYGKLPSGIQSAEK